ncbi:MAG: peptide deformylase [Patescibacteria group bacterium]
MPEKRAIVHLPHKILHQEALAVAPDEIQSPKIRRLISDMKKTLAGSPDGVGLAAPQIGVGLRIFLVSSEAEQLDANTPTGAGFVGPTGQARIGINDTDGKREWEYHAFINPVLKKQARKKTEMAEGCLSLPGKYGKVARAEKVFLEWLDDHGRKHGRGFTKFFARVIQHEMDHLDGLLISDRAKKLVVITHNR